MTAKDQLDSHQYLFLQHIHEAADNCLRIVVSEGRVSGPPKDVWIGEQVISGGNPIDVMPDSPTYEILFPAYIAYSVRNESYAQYDSEEIYGGNRFRLYTKSKFLDFVKTSTFASEKYPGKYHHFEVVTENQIIDVAACEQPSIRLIENAEQPAALSLRRA